MDPKPGSRLRPPLPRRSTHTKGMRTSVEKRLTTSKLPTNLKYVIMETFKIMETLKEVEGFKGYERRKSSNPGFY